MRSFFLWLLLCWVTGIALGQWGELRTAAAVAILLLAIAWRQQLSLPLACAGLVLLALGSLYSTTPVAPNVTCSIALPVSAKVETVRLYPDRATYIVASGDNCRAYVSSARFPALAPGDIVNIAGGKITSTNEITSEGFAGYLARQGITATIQYPTMNRTSAPPASTPLAARLEKIINQIFLEPDAGIAAALLLARTDGLDPILQENFRATGLSHLLAISGMNITLLAGIVIGIFQLLPLSPLSRTIGVSVILWAYMALLSWPISAVRATFFWTIALLAFRLHVLSSLPAVLLLTLLGMLSLRPALVGDVSFQLSVAAVVGIFLIHFLTKRYLRRLPELLKIAMTSVLVTLGATATTWPIIAYHFGTVSLISVPANMVVAPVVGIQMIVAIITVLLGLISPAAALVPASIFHLTVWWMNVASSTMAQISGVYLREVALPPAALAAYYGGLTIGSYWWLKRQQRSWREIWQ